MFDRKKGIYKNKKFYNSNEYLQKIIESYNSQRELKQNKNNNTVFKKILKLENLNFPNDQPKIIFRKYTGNTNFENKKKKQILENNRYLNEEGNKKKLKKYLSHTMDRRHPVFKNFPLSSSKRKNSNYKNSNNVPPKTKTSFSKSISKNFNRPSLNNNFYSTSHHIKGKKDNEKKLSKGINNRKIKSKESKIDKKLLMEKLVKDGIKEIKKRNKNERKYSEQTNRKRKLDFLIKNGIIIRENENEIGNGKNIMSSFGSFEIKKKNKSKSANKNIKKNNLNTFIANSKHDKQKNKPVVDQFEYITKIHKELNKIRSSKIKSKEKNI